jgi:hypothetical protein
MKMRKSGSGVVSLSRGLFGAIAIASFGCAGVGAGTPGWVNGETPAEFPKNKFVSALSTGANLGAAQSAAKAELSRVFSADLKSEIQLIDEETIVGDQSVQGSIFESNTTISSDIVLEGVEAPLHWRDPKTGEIWALAVLERRKECLRIRSEGKDLITELDALARDARTNPNPLLAIRSAVRGAGLGATLDGLQGRSRVLGSQCLNGRTVSTGELRSEAQRLVRTLSFVVNTADVDPRSGQTTGALPQLREKIADDLTTMGFQVGPASGASVIPIDAELRLQRVERGTDWVEFRWEGSAEIGSPVPGDPAIIVAESEGAESHPEPSTARLRSRRKGEQDLARQLKRRLESFLKENGG